MRSDINKLVATIANGASLSDAVVVDGFTPVGIQLPAAWTAAVITFQASFDGDTFGDVFHGGVEYTISGVVAAAYISLDPTAILGATAIKVRSGTTGTGVNQGAERLIQVVNRGL